MSHQPLFALIDCNNFFVSCERVFRPDLEGKPTVVLSSGDGCVIARSNEARAIGVPMGAPVFKHRQLLKDNNVVQFSANFELYGDISRRITEILTSITPRLEVYSIDEAFLDISQLEIKDYEAWGKQVRELILKWVGVPVRIGIAPTKTLAKLASELTKSDPDRRGVRRLMPDSEDLQHSLQQTPLEAIWGVGWRLAPKLRAIGLSTAYDISQLPYATARKHFGSIHGEKLVRELNGQSCEPLEAVQQETKSISATRTFGEDTNQPHVIEAALATFVTRAAIRLRSHNLAAQKLSIFLTTNRHKPNYQKWYREIKLDEPTLDTGVLINQAIALFSTFHEPSNWYHRAGITLSSLKPADSYQTDLLGYVRPAELSKAKARLQAVDAINTKYAAGTVRYAAQDLANSWQPLRKLQSPRYTTSWKELPKAGIKST
jgi:DNA polymerase V